MQDTLKNLSTLITDEYSEMSLEELAVAYKDGLNPSILATAFCQTFNLIMTVSEPYFGLTSQDIASFSLETLDVCLQDYTSGRSKFSTLFTTYLKNRFRAETQALAMNKRKVWQYSRSLDQLMEDSNFDVTTTPEDSLALALSTLQQFDLTSRELLYCILLIQGYKNSEIAKILGVSVMTLSNMRKVLRVKLASLSL